MKLKIEEILWEITNRCNRSCTYCGSKDIINIGKDTSIADKIKIAKQIAKNTKNVTISGGEPLILGFEELKKYTEILKDEGCKVSVVTNGDMLSDTYLRCFDNVGLSVNSPGDIIRIEKLLSEKIDKCYYNKIVIITNLNKINYFDIEQICVLAATFELPIQFQLTMYKEQDDSMLNGYSINVTRNKIDEHCKQFNVPYVLADNLQIEHDCSAGMQTCGILYNGDVVPCLSERSWTDVRVQGNVLKYSLDMIWRNGFSICRFGDDFKCCRDCFDYEEIKILEPKKHPIIKIESDQWNKSNNPIIGDIMTYGVMDFNSLNFLK